MLFDAADLRVPATASCTVIEDTLATQSLRDGSFTWAEPTYSPDPPTVTLVAGQAASVGITNTVQRVYSDVNVNKVVIGPAVGLVPTDRPFTGTITCQYGADAPITTTWLSTLATPALRAGVLVGSVCSAEEDPPGQGGQPVTGDSSYIWLPPVVSAPVTIAPPSVTTPPIVVTNPTDRLFGTFTVTKAVTGATEGIVDPTAPYVMNWACVDGSGNQYEGQLEVPLGGTRTVGPSEQLPAGSECTLDEPLAEMPELVDDAWQWQDPTFTVDGAPAVGDGRTLTFTVPTPQEDTPEPTVAIGVTNTVTRTAGAFTLAKTSDPPSGSVVQPGSVVSYTVTLTSTGTVPVHDVVVTDDLAGVLANATLVDGSVVAPAGTTAVVGLSQLVWTVGDVAAGATLTLTYQVRINGGAGGVTIRNSVSGTGDVVAGCLHAGRAVRRRPLDVVDPVREQGGARGTDARRADRRVDRPLPHRRHQPGRRRGPVRPVRHARLRAGARGPLGRRHGLAARRDPRQPGVERGVERHHRHGCGAPRWRDAHL